MKKRLLLNVILLCITIIGCKSRVKNQSYYSNGSVKSEIIADKGKVKYIEYYENGHIKSDGQLLGSNRIGKWIYYDESDRIKAEGEYENGLKKGIWSYNIADSSYTVDWSVYLSRPIRINIPVGWVLKEDLAPFIPLAGFSDSINWKANFNIVLLNSSGKSIDSVINETIEKNKERTTLEVLAIRDIEINTLKGKEVTEHLLMDTGNLTLIQYFLREGDTVYLLSFFANENVYVNYKELLKEMAYSFNVK